jgi:hypothetical protein
LRIFKVFEKKDRDLFPVLAFLSVTGFLSQGDEKRSNDNPFAAQRNKMEKRQIRFFPIYKKSLRRRRKKSKLLKVLFFCSVSQRHHHFLVLLSENIKHRT